MATDELTIKLDRPEVTAWMKSVQKAGGNLRPFFVQSALVLHTSIMLNFREGGRPRKWTPLSPWTMAGRAARGTVAGHGLGQPILQDQGTVRGSIGSVREITDTSLTYGTHNPIAITHHRGATIRPKNVNWLTLPFPGVTGRARDYENTFVGRGAQGGLIIFQNQEDGSIKPLFLLKKQVKIPARPFVMFQKADEDLLASMALAFHYDPEGYRRLTASLAARGGLQ